MTIINNSYGFVFVHVPKVAGTSITNLLSKYTNYCDLEIGGTKFGEQIQAPYRDRFGISKHSTANQVKALLGAVDWGKKFTFGFSRNPYQRALSAFHFLKEWKSCPKMIQKELSGFSSFEEFVLSGFWDSKNGPDNIFKPQVHWLCDTPIKKNLLVDFVGKVESLESDISLILKEIAGRDFTVDESMPTLNRTKGAKALDFDDRDVISAINEKYAADFEVFGYDVL